MPVTVDFAHCFDQCHCSTFYTNEAQLGNLQNQGKPFIFYLLAALFCYIQREMILRYDTDSAISQFVWFHCGQFRFQRFCCRRWRITILAQWKFIFWKFSRQWEHSFFSFLSDDVRLSYRILVVQFFQIVCNFVVSISCIPITFNLTQLIAIHIYHLSQLFSNNVSFFRQLSRFHYHTI